MHVKLNRSGPRATRSSMTPHSPSSARGTPRWKPTLAARRAEVRAGWGDKYVGRVHQKGKLTTRRAPRAARRPGHRTLRGRHVRQLRRVVRQAHEPRRRRHHRLRRVEGRLCIIIANDNTVASGAWWPRTPEKIQRAQQIALRLRLPTLYLVDCSGLYLPEQRRSFSGARGAGHIFKMNSLLSDAGVPQVAGVFGDCIAGGGYMPIISDAST